MSRITVTNSFNVHYYECYVNLEIWGTRPFFTRKSHLTGKEPQWAVECGAAHGALAMTTPGDTTMATLDEVLQAMKAQTARIAR